jgi:hypothetical protein
MTAERQVMPVMPLLASQRPNTRAQCASQDPTPIEVERQRQVEAARAEAAAEWERGLLVA